MSDSNPVFRDKDQNPYGPGGQAKEARRKIAGRQVFLSEVRVDIVG